jgi:hypothetical protein
VTPEALPEKEALISSQERGKIQLVSCRSERLQPQAATQHRTTINTLDLMTINVLLDVGRSDF